jgi:hypothetical protein
VKIVFDYEIRKLTAMIKPFSSKAKGLLTELIDISVVSLEHFCRLGFGQLQLIDLDIGIRVSLIRLCLA